MANVRVSLLLCVSDLLIFIYFDHVGSFRRIDGRTSARSLAHSCAQFKRKATHTTYFVPLNLCVCAVLSE